MSMQRTRNRTSRSCSVACIGLSSRNRRRLHGKRRPSVIEGGPRARGTRLRVTGKRKIMMRPWLVSGYCSSKADERGGALKQAKEGSWSLFNMHDGRGALRIPEREHDDSMGRC